MPEDYSKLPSNSQMPRKAGDKRKQPKEKPKVEPVVTGKVRTRRPGLGRQIKESFTGDSLQSVAEYVVIDVAVPAAPDKAAIESALGRARGVISQAASALGLSRQALYRRMEKLGIEQA